MKLIRSGREEGKVAVAGSTPIAVRICQNIVHTRDALLIANWPQLFSDMSIGFTGWIDPDWIIRSG